MTIKTGVLTGKFKDFKEAIARQEELAIKYASGYDVDIDNLGMSIQIEREGMSDNWKMRK